MEYKSAGAMSPSYLWSSSKKKIIRRRRKRKTPCRHRGYLGKRRRFVGVRSSVENQNILYNIRNRHDRINIRSRRTQTDGQHTRDFVLLEHIYNNFYYRSI